jgi:hypothetical protein
MVLMISSSVQVQIPLHVKWPRIIGDGERGVKRAHGAVGCSTKKAAVVMTAASNVALLLKHPS